MTEEHPLGAVCGHDDIAHLPPKERAKMRRLRDWLAARSWKPSQAMAVLCGYDPEVGRNTGGADMSFLPGADDFYGVPFGARKPDDLRQLNAGLEEQHGYIGGLRLTTMPPKEAIAKTVAAGVPIPWLKVARDDPECRKYLPRQALDAPAGAPRVPLIAREVASLGGKAKRDKDPKRAEFFPIVRRLVAKGKRPQEIIGYLIDEFGDGEDQKRPSEATVYRWIKEIKDGSEMNRDVEG
ncbi:hypothetical protein [Roseovarius confluentis]|uniref:hypothetical protein n=1 Tax=Roseovarius confluentis TaxID=1852027 RepID=UPI000CDD39A2|nr:hypothetical protein [Roseovarius confluentis]